MPADNTSQPISGHRGRDRWMCALAAASDLSTMAVRLALRLCVSFNCKTGQCDPGYPKLAEDMAVSKRTVSRAIDELETAGWVSVDRTGGDNTRNAQIKLLIPGAGETQSGDNMLSPEKEPTGATSGDNILSPENPSLQVTENAPSGDRNGGFQVTDRVATQITCEPVNLKRTAKPPSCSADADRESIPANSANTSDDAPPNQRAPNGALIETDAAQQQTPSATSIGAAAEVYRRGREVLGADADAVTAKLLAVYEGDTEDALNTLAAAEEEESGPSRRQYVESDIEAAARRRELQQ
jgi:hypothetical protein